MLCLTLTGSTIQENLAAARKYEGKAEFLELRADLLDPAEYRSAADFPRLIRASAADPPAVICTLRRGRDGGKFTGTEEERARLFEQFLQAEKGPDYLDFEEDFFLPRLSRMAKERKTRIIRSFHDFTGVPEDLPALMRRLPAMEGEIPKAAVMPGSSEELLRLVKAYRDLEILRNPEHKRMILLGMGEYGFPTRILAPLLGSWISFASPAGTSAAPGHADPDLLLGLYRYNEISPETEVFGVIGNPIAHSKSPEYHNNLFKEQNLPAVYLPFLVDSVECFFRVAEILDIRGISVTIPHKRSVIPYLKETDYSVKAADACNTVFRIGREWRGTNTDVPGFLTPLPEMPLKGITAAVIGAGGAARGVIWALIREGAKTTVYNRTEKKAQQVAEELGELGKTTVTAKGLKDLGNDGAPDLIVQCTSAGMHPDVNEDPIPEYRFNGTETVYDIIYTPWKTALLRRAEAAGCGIITGDKMFRAQARHQYKIFSGLTRNTAQQSGKGSP